MQMLWSGKQRGGRKRGPTPTIWGGAAFLASRERPQRPGPGLPVSGPGVASVGNADIVPRQAESSARGWAGYGRSWQDAFISSCQDTQPWPPTYGVSARPPTIGAGGAAAAGDRRDITSSFGVGSGHPRFEGCGRGSMGVVSGSPLRPPPPASSSRTCVRLLRCWSSWKIQGWGRCLVWPFLECRGRSRTKMRLCCCPRVRRGRGVRMRRGAGLP